MWKGSLDEVKELMKEFPREILIQVRANLSDPILVIFSFVLCGVC